MLRKSWPLFLSTIIFSFILGDTSYSSDELTILNGWFSQDGKAIWGYAQHNGWWGGYRDSSRKKVNKYKVRTAITRNAPGKYGPSLTEDLDKLTTAMKSFGYPGFEHNYGLWFDRRRDAHDTICRANSPVSPFLEQPWARSTSGKACDGLTKYDLTNYNPLYFNRLREMAGLSDSKGTILFINFYMQHALLEQQAHYADFPWHPDNTIQNTAMPKSYPAANIFYNIHNSARRDLHEKYIQKTLDELGGYSNVIFLPSQEYTGPKSFIDFVLDTVVSWENSNGDIKMGLGATKDVLDAVLHERADDISVIDLRYWWYKKDGSLYSPRGGKQVPGRYAAGWDIVNQNKAEHSSPEQIYRQVRYYRNIYPGKAIIHQIEASRQMTWAFFMGGGSILIRYMQYDDGSPNPYDPPANYSAPEHSKTILPLYNFINSYLSTELLKMKPADIILADTNTTWALANPGWTYLVYSLNGGTINLEVPRGDFNAMWLNPRTGQLSNTGTLSGRATLHTPSAEDWALFIQHPSTTTYTNNNESDRLLH